MMMENGMIREQGMFLLNTWRLVLVIHFVVDIYLYFVNEYEQPFDILTCPIISVYFKSCPHAFSYAEVVLLILVTDIVNL